MAAPSSSLASTSHLSRRATAAVGLQRIRCSWAGGRAGYRRRAPGVCFVVSPSQPGPFLWVLVPLSCVLSAGHWRWIIRAEFRFVYVCTGLAAVNVPAATISERTLVSSLLEVVSDDLLKLNNNLKSVSFLLSESSHAPFLLCSLQMFLLVLVHL